MQISSLLGIKYPIIQGGMAWASDAKLAAAVSNAGGAGIIGAGGRDAQWLIDEIRLTRQLTDRPFGVNIALLVPNHQELMEVVYEEKPCFVTIGAGNPIPFIDKLHSKGIKILPVVPSVKLAQRVEAAGADGIIVEGMEAGGHIGQLTTMALLSNVIPLVKIPVVAAGGIADGRGVAAALLMGAAGVQMGSRFIMTQESPTHVNAKQAILRATDTDSVVTAYGTPDATRGLKNEFTKKFFELTKSGAAAEQIKLLVTGTNRLAAQEGDIINGYVQVGQSLNLLQDIPTCQQVIARTVQEANALLQAATHKIIK